MGVKKIILLFICILLITLAVPSVNASMVSISAQAKYRPGIEVPLNPGYSILNCVLAKYTIAIEEAGPLLKKINKNDVFGPGIDNLVAYTEVTKGNGPGMPFGLCGSRRNGHSGPGRHSRRQTHFALKDALGSVTRLTDSSGRVSHRYFYSPFGKSAGFGSVAGNPFTYTGRRLDPTGLLFYRSRYMIPGTGRFMQADRWGGSAWSPWQSHPFIYVNNNPMVFVDPYGLWSWSAFGTGFLKGAGAGLAYGFASGSISAVAKIVAKAIPGFGSVILAYQIFNTAKAAYDISNMASQLSQIKMSDKQQSKLVGKIVGGVIGSVIGGKAGKKLVNKYKSQIESAIRNYVPDKYLEGGSLDSNVGSGSLVIEDGNFSESEIRAAKYMAKSGKNVTLRQPVGTRAAGGTSDLLVDGVNYDVYTPRTSSANRIISAIAKKNTQTKGVVLDLTNSSVNSNQLGNILARVRGAGAINITDIVIIGD